MSTPSRKQDADGSHPRLLRPQGSRAAGPRARETRLRASIQAHGDTLARLLLLFGAPPPEVDDALQEVLLVFSRRLDDVLPGKERAFLIRTAKFVALRYRDAARGHFANGEIAESTPSPVASPDTILSKKQALSLLCEILDQMPEEQADVYFLFEVEELSSHDIAEMLEVPRGTVVSRLRAARKEVRRRLNQRGLLDGAKNG